MMEECCLTHLLIVIETTFFSPRDLEDAVKECQDFIHSPIERLEGRILDLLIMARERRDGDWRRMFGN